ncbi:MAG TPA: M28 family peptidase [Gemmatimonadaceae bacterium]|nr:M28 family peptidase [Gemmatimonadaceae bacterium]
MSTTVRVVAALSLVVLTLLSVLRDTRPPRPVPAASPDTVFSAERAMRHVEAIAARPHPIGSADHDRVRDYIVAQLAALGMRPTLQVTTGIGTRHPVAGRVQNVLAWTPGTATGGKAVLLVAHYDGVGAGPAAGDDASGVAAMLETLRAIRARKRPLVHDLFALFTDGEESGLLGAAAFVREHPWAKDVGVILNFDSRGTRGRAYMFETAPGDASTVAALRHVDDVTAGSVFTTIYRSLANDSDLSELVTLGQPAMNFGFVDGLLRYHTSRDDFAHLDSGTVQHEGAQMLALAKNFGSGPLPLVRSGDAVFFDFPFLGMVEYPRWIAVLLVLVALVLVALVVTPPSAGMAWGFGASVIGTAVTALVAAHIELGGVAAWSGWSALAIVCFVLAVNAAMFALARRQRDDLRALHAGALVLWLIIAITTTIIAPGASYLFVWPLLFAAVAARSSSAVPHWISAIVALTLLAGFAYAAAVVTLGVATLGAASLAIFTSLIAWLLLPLLAGVAGSARWAGAPWLFAAGLVCTIVTIAIVHPSADNPLSTNLVYAEHADSGQAWLAVNGRASDWSRGIIPQPSVGPSWTSHLSASGAPLRGRAVSRVPLDAPAVTRLRDTTIDAHRRLVLRVMAPRGATTLVMRGSGAAVLSASIDGRVVDTTRYRYRGKGWVMDYSAPPDSGVLVALSLPPGQPFAFDVTARRPGLPSIPSLPIPPRPPSIVPANAGDVSMVYRRFTF